MPDADMDMTTHESWPTRAGRRPALPGRLGGHHRGRGRLTLHRGHGRCGRARTVGYGLNEGVQMGPVITQREPGAHHQLPSRKARRKGHVLVDGLRQERTLRRRLLGLPHDSGRGQSPGDRARRSSGLVLSLMHADDIDGAIAGQPAFGTTWPAPRLLAMRRASSAMRRTRATWHQHGGCAYGLFLQRLERPLLRRPPRPGPSRRRVLHPDESRGGAPVAGVESDILNSDRETEQIARGSWPQVSLRLANLISLFCLESSKRAIRPSS
ncbi:MAG: hypothetical protein R3A10_07620 [Caldilineaceae bacterium]